MTDKTAEPSGAAKMFGDFAPALVGFTDDVLSARSGTRGAITAGTAAWSRSPPGHQRQHRAARLPPRPGQENGMTEAELIEAITHLAFYAGWPQAMAAMAVARQVFTAAQTSNKETGTCTSTRSSPPGRARPSGSPGTCTSTRSTRGTLSPPGWPALRPLHPRRPHRLALPRRRARPCYITEGTALLGTRDGTVVVARPGQAVCTPPGEEHWHGAAPDAFMVHIALYEGTERRRRTTWLEHVTERAVQGRRGGSRTKLRRNRDHARSSHLRARATSASRTAPTRDHQPDRRGHPPVRHLCVRIGPVGLARHRPGHRAHADGPRVRRHRRGGRQRGHDHQARPVRHRLVLRLRQHLRDLPGRLPEPLRPPGIVGAGGAQAEYAAGPARRRHPGRHPGQPDADLVPSLLAASDVLGTGWFGAVAADVRPGQDRRGRRRRRGRPARRARRPAAGRGADHRDEPPRAAQKLALEFGATDIVTERGDEGVARIKELTGGLRRALGHRGRRHPGIDDAGHPFHPARRARRLRRRRPRRPAARRGAVLRRGPPARRPRPRPPLPARPDRPHRDRTIDPGEVFDLTLPLDQAAEGYRAMDERRAIKTLLRP